MQPVYLEPAQSASACVIWLHGLGADGHDFVDVVPMLGLSEDLAVRFIFPHAPIQPVTVNGGMAMRAWYDLYSFNKLEKQDEVGLKKSVELIENLIAAQTDIEMKRIVVMGFSQGGAVALEVGLNYEYGLAGIAGLSTYLPIADRYVSREAVEANLNTPVLIQHGTEDEVVPAVLGQQAVAILENQGRSVGYQSYPMAHQVCQAQMVDLGGWLTNCLA